VQSPARSVGPPVIDHIALVRRRVGSWRSSAVCPARSAGRSSSDSTLWPGSLRVRSPRASPSDSADHLGTGRQPICTGRWRHGLALAGREFALADAEPFAGQRLPGGAFPI